MEQFVHFFLSLIDAYGYAGLFAVMMAGNMGIPVGTELVMPAAGALVATGHLSSTIAVGFIGTAGEVAGGLVLYAIGYYGGRPFVARYGSYIKVSEARLDAFHGWYERHGNIVVFVCRFIPFVRGVSSLPAGVSRMQKRYFLTYTTAGSAIYCFGLAFLGRAIGGHFQAVAPQIRGASIVAGALVVVALVVYLALRRVRASRDTTA